MKSTILISAMTIIFTACAPKTLSGCIAKGRVDASKLNALDASITQRITAYQLSGDTAQVAISKLLTQFLGCSAHDTISVIKSCQANYREKIANLSDKNGFIDSKLDLILTSTQTESKKCEGEK